MAECAAQLHCRHTDCTKLVPSLLCRRQELQRQLLMAQEAAQEEVDEAEFAAASAAVSRLTEGFSPSRVLQPSLAGQVGLGHHAEGEMSGDTVFGQ